MLPAGGDQNHLDLSPAGGDQDHQDCPTGGDQDHQNLHPVGGDQDHQNLSPVGGDQDHQDCPAGGDQDHQNMHPTGGDQDHRGRPEPPGLSSRGKQGPPEPQSCWGRPGPQGKTRTTRIVLQGETRTTGGDQEHQNLSPAGGDQDHRGRPRAPEPQPGPQGETKSTRTSVPQGETRSTWTSILQGETRITGGDQHHQNLSPAGGDQDHLDLNPAGGDENYQDCPARGDQDHQYDSSPRSPDQQYDSSPRSPDQQYDSAPRSPDQQYDSSPPSYSFYYFSSYSNYFYDSFTFEMFKRSSAGLFSSGNFCNATTLNGHKFQDTPIGWFAYSEGTCPEGTGGAGKPEASTRCLQNSDGSLSFETPRVFQCDQTLASIQQNLTSGADLEVLASSTQILTSNPENLQAENVTAAARIANTLLLSPNATESVRVAAVATVSQLLNASVERNTEQINATQELTLTLDQLSVNLSSNSNISQVVQPNLVVQSAQVLAKDSQGVQFTSLSGSSGSFVANRIQLNTNVSKVTVENGFKADALVYIQFPLGSSVSGRQKASNVSLGFVLYQNDRFFPSTRYKKSRASIRVLSANVGGLDRSVVPQHVEMRFRVKIPNKTYLHDFSCVFWNYTLEDWSTRGCSKENSSNEELRCSCNHTTNFAALWSYRESYTYADALEAISIVGLSFSMLGLIVTIIHHIHVNFWQKSQERQTKLNSKMSLLCIYTSLLAFIITFLSGVQNSVHQSNKKMDPSPQNDILESDLHVEPDQGSCTAVVALLHFFLLATFAWNSVYGTQLVLLVRSMRRSLPPHWTPLSLGIGWGVPAVVMAITLAVTYRVENPLGYRQEEFCWLAAQDQNKHFSFGKPMFWGFLLPVGLILIYNTVLLVLTSLTTCRDLPCPGRLRLHTNGPPEALVPQFENHGSAACGSLVPVLWLL
ncbi:adhesion G-protein coupled receptor G7 [Kryptolebias marmoratus]|uniref:adhesion G-protein coupled receptor G7 n=1 Tax=Kryptolebias marmoratus TaxID=37003 RepID=UPI0018ACC005|nr:adhesion G-protein coupled receptor G7 [Kryptolebias marmoratus]